MIEPKVILSFPVKGAILMAEDECKKDKKDNYETFRLRIEYTENSQKHRETLTVRTRKARPAKRCLNIGKEAYCHMVSEQGFANTRIGRKEWCQMKKSERLAAHLDMIVETLGGYSGRYSFQILDD